MTKEPDEQVGKKLILDFDGTDPQSDYSINFLLSNPMMVSLLKLLLALVSLTCLLQKVSIWETVSDLHLTRHLLALDVRQHLCVYISWCIGGYLFCLSCPDLLTVFDPQTFVFLSICSSRLSPPLCSIQSSQ